MIVTSTTSVTTSSVDSAAFGLIVIVLLVMLLASKELVGLSKNQPLKVFNRNLNVCIFPLIGALVFTEIMEITRILS